MKTIVLATIAAAALAPVAIYVAARVHFEGSTIALEAQYPQFSKENIRTVHKSMVLDTLSGALADHDMSSDEVCDTIFRARMLDLLIKQQ